MSLKIEVNVLGEQFSQDRGIDLGMQEIFIDYYIRYYLSQKQGLIFEDRKAESVIYDGKSHIKDFMDDYEEEPINRRVDLAISFQRLQNRTATLEDIFKVSTCHKILLGEEGYSFKEYYLPDNLRISINKYIERIDCEDVCPSPNFTNMEIGIKGDGHLLLNDKIVGLKISRENKLVYFYHLFIFSALHYINTGSQIKTVEIYNPLRNEISSIKIDNWDFFPLIAHFQAKCTGKPDNKLNYTFPFIHWSFSSSI